MRLWAVVAAARRRCSLRPAGRARGASPYVRYGVQDDAWLRFGPGTLEQRLDRLDSLGVELVRLNVHVERGRGAPRRLRLERLRPGRSTACTTRGIEPVLTLYSTPGLGERRPRRRTGRRRAARPSPPSRAAAALRYPLVKRWLIWNEPNQRRWLQPTDAGDLRQAPAEPGVRRDPQGPAGRARRRRRRPRRARPTGGVSPVAWIDGMAAARRAARRVRAQPVPAQHGRDAVHRRLRPLRHDHDGDARPARRARRQRVRHAQAHLADRVRLPDEPARPVPRRLEGEAVALHRRGGAARVPRAAGRHADPVPDPGRARARPLAERRPDRAGTA